MSSNLQRKPNAQPRQLFKYYIDKNIADDAAETTYFFRMNRFRFNSYNQSRFLRWARFRNPLIFGAGVAIIYNFAFKFYEPVPEQH